MTKVIYKKGKEKIEVGSKLSTFFFCLIFGVLYPLYKKDWIGALLMFISMLAGIIIGISGIVLIINAVMYRYLYIKRLIDDGFKEVK